MIGARSMSTPGQPLAQHSLEIPGLGIGHGHAHDNSSFLGFPTHGRDADPSDKANNAVCDLNSYAGHIETGHNFGLGKWGSVFAHFLGSISPKRPNPMMHSPISRFRESSHTDNRCGPAIFGQRLIATISPDRGEA